jgi:hypothetical protein
MCSVRIPTAAGNERSLACKRIFGFFSSILVDNRVCQCATRCCEGSVPPRTARHRATVRVRRDIRQLAALTRHHLADERGGQSEHDVQAKRGVTLSNFLDHLHAIAYRGECMGRDDFGHGFRVRVKWCRGVLTAAAIVSFACLGCRSRMQKWPTLQSGRRLPRRGPTPGQRKCSRLLQSPPAM